MNRRLESGRYVVAERAGTGSDAPFRWYRDDVAPGLTLVEQRIAEGVVWTSITHDESGSSIVGWYAGIARARRWIANRREELHRFDWTRPGRVVQNDTAVAEWVKQLELDRDRGDRP